MDASTKIRMCQPIQILSANKAGMCGFWWCMTDVWWCQDFSMQFSEDKSELMTDTRKRWIRVGIALGMVPESMPGEKMKKFSNFLNFLKMSFFWFLTYFSSKICYFEVLLGRWKYDVLVDVSQWNGLKITSIG